MRQPTYPDDSGSITDAPSTSEGSRLKERIISCQSGVTIIGMGYVGLPLAVYCAESGFSVTGFDIDPSTTKHLASGKSHIGDIEDGRVASLLSSGQLIVSNDEDCLENADVFVICVPTPLTVNQTPDMTHIHNAACMTARHLRPDSLVLLESTTYPGCTRDELLPELEKSGLRCEEDFWLAFSPERVNPGGAQHNITNTPKLVGGIGEDSTAIAALFYERFIDNVVPLSTAEVAEMAKLLENVYRSVNIALANELALICNSMGISVWEVIDAAATKPFGFTPFYPGPGLGGHCIPIDPFYLAWKARELSVTTEFIELAGKVNTAMPRYVVDRTISALNEHSKCLRASSVLMIGAAYKADVSDLRESPVFRVTEILLEAGAEISYHDPYVPELALNGKEMNSVTLDEETLGTADCVVVLTPHSTIDWELVGNASNLIVDTRNIVPLPNSKVFSI